MAANIERTEHPLIMRANEEELAWDTVHAFLRRFDRACNNFDAAEVRRLLRESLPAYRPGCEFEDYLWAPVKIPEIIPAFVDPALERQDQNVPLTTAGFGA